jgi:hypothetical protein
MQDRGPAELSDAVRQDDRILTAAVFKSPQPACQGLSETAVLRDGVSLYIRDVQDVQQ